VHDSMMPGHFGLESLILARVAGCNVEAVQAPA
jgi:hypothetical protein